MSVALDLLLGIAGLPFALAAVYLGVLTLRSGRLPVPVAKGPPTVRFDVIVPAHNEEAGIADTVRSLSAMDYPASLRRIVVVADNCIDATAAKAKAAGATVLVRQNADLRGKGYALEYAFGWSAKDGFADAVVVVDADTVASPNLLRAFAVRLGEGHLAVQAEYGVSNPNASWRTRLMVIALSLFHGVRSLARERLGVSAGLRGNGMCFSHALLAKVPHTAYSLVEDLEYGIALGRAGVRVAFAHEAQVLGEMVVGEKGSRSQRRRWEGGRIAIARAHGWPLLRDGIARRSALLFDLGMDVVVPPLSWIVLGVAGGFAVVVALSGMGWFLPLSVATFGLSVLALGAYVVRGWWLSGTGARGAVDLMMAPVFVAWKVVLALRGGGRSNEWVRTARRGEAP